MCSSMRESMRMRNGREEDGNSEVGRDDVLLSVDEREVNEGCNRSGVSGLCVVADAVREI